MPNMNDRDHVVFDPIVDDVRIAVEPECVNAEVFDDASASRRIGQRVDLVFEEGFDSLRGPMIVLIEVFEDCLAVGESALRVSNPHMPWSLSAAATTSSGTY